VARSHVAHLGTRFPRDRLLEHAACYRSSREVRMPRQAWTEKRERQYEHIKEEEKERGRSEDTAERIAAATVNRTRTAKGETKVPKSAVERAKAQKAATSASKRNAAR
jgi:hypothetical protein